MSLTDIQKNRAKPRIDLDELPEILSATVKSVEWKTDEKDRNCLYVEYTDENGKDFTQKYSPMHLADLAEALDTLKLSGIKQGQKFKLVQKPYRIGFPRMIPTEVLK